MDGWLDAAPHLLTKCLMNSLEYLFVSARGAGSVRTHYKRPSHMHPQVKHSKNQCASSGYLRIVSMRLAIASA